MTNTDNKLKIQFDMDTVGTTTASEIVDIAKGIFGNLDAYADHIIDVAEYKGIPISGELQELQKQTIKAKIETEAQKQRDNAQAIAEKQKQTLEEYQKNLSNGHSPNEPEMIEAIAKVGKEIANLTIPQEQNYLATFDGYLQECLSYDPSKDFSPGLFGNIPFPNGTVSYIGARTSRGKTASMINLAREALTQITQPRKVVFVTLEMSAKHLLTRLVLSISYAQAKEKGDQNVLENIEKDSTLLNNLYYNYVLKGKESPDGRFKTFKSYVDKAVEYVKRFMNQEQLTIYDARGHNFETIASNIKRLASVNDTRVGDIVLLDYIQRMPSTNKASDTYMRVKHISEGICQTAAVTNAVIIAGAQFNRESVSSDNKDDTFSEASFRESGDIEQDAEIAIGLGWKLEDHSKRFYKVLKTRSGGYVGDSFYFDWNGAYCYMARTKVEYNVTGKSSSNQSSDSNTPKGTIGSKKYSDLV